MAKNPFQQGQIRKDGSRSGILNTRRGAVRTPFFMPVATRAAVKGVDPAAVKATGAQVLLSNTYHLHLQPGEKVIKKLGGLHKFSLWDGPMLTDSGGFQVFSLAKIRKITEEGVLFTEPKTGDKIFISPEKSIKIQLDLGADIIMAFDDLTGLGEHDRHRTEEAVQRTHRWLARCVAEFQKQTKKMAKPPLLFGIAQGGLDKKLRAQSLEFVQSQPVDGVAIGGLSVGETRQEMHQVLEYLATLYDPSKIRYLMGVGDPIDLEFAIQNGIDMADCVMPTRNARHGTVWVHGGCTTSSCQSAKPAAPEKLAAPGGVKLSGAPSEYHAHTSERSPSFPSPVSTCKRCGNPYTMKLNLTSSKFISDKSPIEQGCDCQTCQAGYSRAFLRQLYKTDNPLAGSLASIHNLRYLARLCEAYQSA